MLCSAYVLSFSPCLTLLQTNQGREPRWVWKTLGIPDHFILIKSQQLIRLIGKSEPFEIARRLEASISSEWGKGIYLNRKPELLLGCFVLFCREKVDFNILFPHLL